MRRLIKPRIRGSCRRELEESQRQARWLDAVQLCVDCRHHWWQLGSPVVDREGKMVGIIFDGNIQSLTADFNYTEEQSRSVSVHIAAY